MYGRLFNSKEHKEYAKSRRESCRSFSFTLNQISIMKGFVLICLVLFACKGKDKSDKHVAGAAGGDLSESFKTLTLPYQLSDTAFLKNRDTATLHAGDFSLPDSLKTKIFGKTAKVHYTAMGRTPERNGAVLYLVKAVSGNKKAALLYGFTQNNFGAVIPF